MERRGLERVLVWTPRVGEASARGAIQASGNPLRGSEINCYNYANHIN
jgi:hypothetical protein